MDTGQNTAPTRSTILLNIMSNYYQSVSLCRSWIDHTVYPLTLYKWLLSTSIILPYFSFSALVNTLAPQWTIKLSCWTILVYISVFLNFSWVHLQRQTWGCYKICLNIHQAENLPSLCSTISNIPFSLVSQFLLQHNLSPTLIFILPFFLFLWSRCWFRAADFYKNEGVTTFGELQILTSQLFLPFTHQ